MSYSIKPGVAAGDEVQKIFKLAKEKGFALPAVLLFGGGLKALQTASVATGLSFAILLLIMCYSLFKGVREDYKEHQKRLNQKEKEEYQETIKKLVEAKKQKM